MATIVTFYSYKGGTGRSMALANVAWILASGGRRVLVLDWDLEAPGLHHYFRPFLPDAELLAMDVRGVIDFVFEYVAAAATPPPQTSDGRTPARPRDWYKPYADIKQCAIPLCWPSGEQVRFGKNGGIDFVPAGRQIPDVYAARVNGFNWTHFYEHQSGGAFMDAVRDSMQSYDYVLIDSRTGVSDTAGICTVQMPDMLVLCFTLNNQSIKGASGVASQLAPALGGKPVLPVPMRIDPFEKDKLNKRREYAHRVFEKLTSALSEKLEVDPARYWSDVEIPYFASYAYEETLAPFEKFSGSLGSMLPALEKLTGYISGNSVSRFSAVISETQRDAVVAVYQETGSAGSESSPAAQPGSADSAARDITLQDVLQLVRRRWIPLLAMVIVIAGFAAALVPWGISIRNPPPVTAVAEAYQLREAGNVDGAIATLTRALATEQDPALRSRMFRDRAYAYKLQEKWTASIDDLSQARLLDANGSDLEDRAFAYLKATNLEAAIRDYEGVGDRKNEASLREVLKPTQPSNVFLFLPIASASKIPDVPLGHRYVNRRFWWHPFVNQIRYTDAADETEARAIAGRLRQAGISVPEPVPMRALTTKGRRIEVWLNERRD
jgi:tetratricopeptide (TPR) repeat protein